MDVRIRSVALVLATATAMVGCTTSGRSGPSGASATQAPASQRAAGGVDAGAHIEFESSPSSASSNDSCPVTIPMSAFVPPPPAPPTPPASYHAAWFGSSSLWTMLDTQGERWHDLPKDAAGFGQKTFWWSALWDAAGEPEPAISVAGRRLDSAGAFATTGLGTNASADFGVAMLIGVSVPAAGCWELTGTYRGESLSFVVAVDG